MSDFATELGRLMTAQGVGPSELARRSGWSTGYISQLRSGKGYPSVAVAADLDAALSAGGALIAVRTDSPVHAYRPPGEPRAPRETRRKTISVDEIRGMVNTRLGAPDEPDRDITPQQAYRLGVASLLEQILHQTGNYRGFGYQAGQVTHYGTSPQDPSVITDETRRVYF